MPIIRKHDTITLSDPTKIMEDLEEMELTIKPINTRKSNVEMIEGRVISKYSEFSKPTKNNPSQLKASKIRVPIPHGIPIEGQEIGEKTVKGVIRVKELDEIGKKAYFSFIDELTPFLFKAKKVVQEYFDQCVNPEFLENDDGVYEVVITDYKKKDELVLSLDPGNNLTWLRDDFARLTNVRTGFPLLEFAKIYAYANEETKKVYIGFNWKLKNRPSERKMFRTSKDVYIKSSEASSDELKEDEDNGQDESPEEEEKVIFSERVPNSKRARTSA